MTEVREFLTFSDKRYTISYEPTSHRDSHYCVALHKSGSVLFDNIVKALCAAANRSFVDVEVQLFDQGLHFGHCDHQLLDFCGQPGFVYTGFRGLWQLTLLRRFRDSTKLMLVRDPRDIAISFYHSMAKSHTVPADGEARDVVLEYRDRAMAQAPSDWVVGGGADGVLDNFNSFARVSRDHAIGPLKVYRYEDVIYAKAEWAADIAAQLGISLPAAALTAIVAKEDIFPATEDPNQHIRRVHPGGYRDSLTRAAIEHIEQRCAEAMAVFGYPIDDGARTAAGTV